MLSGEGDSHPLVSPFLSFSLITEFADNGDLDGKIKSLQNSEDRMEETEVFNYILQMAKALKALHSSNIIHRDLKVFKK